MRTSLQTSVKEDLSREQTAWLVPCPSFPISMRAQTPSDFPWAPAGQTFAEHVFAEESTCTELSIEIKSWNRCQKKTASFCYTSLHASLHTSLHRRYRPRRRPNPSPGQRPPLFAAWLALSSCDFQAEAAEVCCACAEQLRSSSGSCTFLLFCATNCY